MGSSSILRLPKDAILVELRPEVVTFETRECLLPGTRVAMKLVMENHDLPLQLPVTACLVTEKDRLGYIYHCQFSLAPLSETDRHIVSVFINKGRGAPELAPLPPQK